MWPLPAPSPANADYSVTTATVHDDRTKLDWERVAPVATSTWGDADARCQSLALEGPGWRLPTRIELLSLVDYGATAPSLNAVVFAVEAESGTFWSATPDARSPPGVAWTVAFGAGESVAVARVAPARSRCVRGDSPARAHYAEDGDRVTDLFTGLAWQRQVTPTSAVTWTEALLACQSARTGGRSGWRLPTARELESIVDVRAAAAPTLRSGLFATAETGWTFWSITGVAGTNQARVWAISFTPDHASTTLDSSGGATARVRCVMSL